jgi:hypothetical protein
LAKEPLRARCIPNANAVQFLLSLFPASNC